MPETEHNFGGVWTEVKLEILGKYLNFYTEALKNKPSELSPFKLVYIDAMAGTGHRTETINKKQDTERHYLISQCLLS